MLLPSPDNPALTRALVATDHNNNPIPLSVVEEKPLAIYLNSREVITQMTIGDYPEYLAIGFLKNQNLLTPDNPITNIEYHPDLQTVVVRTKYPTTNLDQKLQRQIQTSGCAQGSMFEEALTKVESINLTHNTTPLTTSTLYHIQHHINRLPSLYLKAGAIHGCALFQEKNLIAYIEDVGRHNAADKIAGYMHTKNIKGADKIFYTTGRLTSEMVIKCAFMEIPILLSRSGFTAWGIDLAQQTGLTLVGRLRGNRFVILSGKERVVFDGGKAEQEDERHQRKSSQKT